MYEVSHDLLKRRPEIRIGDQMFTVDDRLSTFCKLNETLSKLGNAVEAFEAIVSLGLSDEALATIQTMDVSFVGMQKIVVLIMAAIQGISEDEAERRFQSVARP